MLPDIPAPKTERLDEWTRLIPRCPRRKHAAGGASRVYVTRSRIGLFYALARFTVCEIRQAAFRGDGRCKPIKVCQGKPRSIIDGCDRVCHPCDTTLPLQFPTGKGSSSAS